MRTSLIFSFFLVAAISCFSLSCTTEQKPLAESKSAKSEVDSKNSEPDSTNSERELVVKNSYEEGIATGYRAVLNQMGEPTPKIVRYASEHYEENKEDFNKGYVEGYHKAADMWSKRIISNGEHCPY